MITLTEARTDHDVSDLLNVGHGFLPWGQAEPPRLSRQCRYAEDSHDVFTGSEWYCEFSGNPDAVADGGHIPNPVQEGSWTWKNCRCNWCLLRILGFEDDRGEREVCFRPECQRRLKADQVTRNRESQRDRQRELAADFIVTYPDFNDKQIAALIDQTGLVGGPKCAAKRVREARTGLDGSR